MNIVMITNTYLPHVGGVARSVQRFVEEYRRLGHSVAVVAPGDRQPNDVGVFRVPAFKNINNSSFSLPFPITGEFERALLWAGTLAHVDVVHSHHPFLLGELAFRLSRKLRAPLVFTHHTMYEQYAYAAGAIGGTQIAVAGIIAKATVYANACSQVFAPSSSTSKILRQRGVTAPILVLPTGVDIAKFGDGNGAALRARLGISRDAPVIGYVGRLAPEKNLDVLLAAVSRVLADQPDCHFICVGDGPLISAVRGRSHGRFHVVGSLTGQALIDAYHALDVFLFSSKSETQGMVLCEALAAGVPVVAVNAPGADDVVVDGVNGRLVLESELADATVWTLRNRARLTTTSTVQRFSQTECAKQALACYAGLKFTEHPAAAILGSVRTISRMFR